MVRYKIDRLVRQPARKRSGSILTTPEPAWGIIKDKVNRAPQENTGGCSSPSFRP